METKLWVADPTTFGTGLFLRLTDKATGLRWSASLKGLDRFGSRYGGLYEVEVWKERPGTKGTFGKRQLATLNTMRPAFLGYVEQYLTAAGWTRVLDSERLSHLEVYRAPLR